MATKMPKVPMIVIVGGGLSAMLCAARLIEQSSTVHVLVLNRTRFAFADDEDNGVFPQEWNHTFVLSAKALQMVYDWIPGSKTYLQLAGSPLFSWGSPNVDISFPDGKLTQNHPLGIFTHSLTRGLFERMVYGYVTKLAESTGRLELVERVDVTGLIRNGDTVTGVKVKPRSGAVLPTWFQGRAPDQAIMANEVILATGSGTSWYEWFKEIDAEVPPAIEVDARLSYLSADFTGIKLPEKAEMFATGDKFDRAMVIAKVEGDDRFRVTIFAYNLETLPDTDAEFIALAKTVSEDGAKYLASGKMTTKVHKYKKCESRMHQVWKVKKWLNHVYLLGDMLAKMNPKFGQGATLAMLEIDLLLHELKYGSAQSYNKKVKKLLSFPWSMVTAADFDMKRSYGDTDVPPQTYVDKLIGRFSGHLLRIAGKDENWPVARAFFQVSNFLSGPSAMLHPRVLYIALREWLVPKEKLEEF